jgi:hypothetical protein
LYYIKPKSKQTLYQDSGISLRFFLICTVAWSQSAPSSAKKGSYKKLITVSINHSLYKNIVIIVSLFSNISIIYIVICICIYLNLCILQHLINKVLYQNASKRDIQHIHPFAQSVHATIKSVITQPLIFLLFILYSNPSPYYKKKDGCNWGRWFNSNTALSGKGDQELISEINQKYGTMACSTPHDIR